MTSVERTLGSSGDAKLRHIIIEFDMAFKALFAIQLNRILFSILPVESVPDFSDYLIVIQQTFQS